MAMMKPKKRQKLCYNCEGEVDLDVIVCPYCASDLREEKPELQRSAFSASASSVKQLNTEHSLYPPQYAEERQEVEDGPIFIEQRPSREPQIHVIEEEEEEVEGARSLLVPIVLLTSGMHLFVLALALLLLSDQGTLILKWDARFWILYLIASAPLMLFGYRSLSKL
jgi:hypothetical protein